MKKNMMKGTHCSPLLGAGEALRIQVKRNVENWTGSCGRQYRCYSWARGLWGEVDFSQSGREKPKGDKSGILQLPEEWF